MYRGRFGHLKTTNIVNNATFNGFISLLYMPGFDTLILKPNGYKPVKLILEKLFMHKNLLMHNAEKIIVKDTAFGDKRHICIEKMQ